MRMSKSTRTRRSAPDAANLNSTGAEVPMNTFDTSPIYTTSRDTTPLRPSRSLGRARPSVPDGWIANIPERPSNASPNIQSDGCTNCCFETWSRSGTVWISGKLLKRLLSMHHSSLLQRRQPRIEICLEQRRCLDARPDADTRAEFFDVPRLFVIGRPFWQVWTIRVSGCRETHPVG